MAVMLTLIAVQQLVGLGTPWLFGKLMNAVVERADMAHSLTIVAGMCATMFVTGVILPYLRERLEGARIDFPVPRYIGQLTLNKVLSLSISQLTNRNSGITTRVINQGEAAAVQFVRTALYQILPMGFRICVITTILFWMDLTVGLTVLGAGVVIAYIMRTMNRGFVDDLKKLEELSIESSRHRGETLEHVTAVIGNAQEARMAKEWEKKSHAVQEFGEPMWLKFVQSMMTRNGVVITTQVAIVVIAMFDVYAGTRSVGDLAVFWGWSGSALGEVALLSQLQREMASHYASIRKFFELLDAVPEVHVVQNPIRPEQFAGEIEFRNVTLSYHTRRWVSADSKEEKENPRPMVAQQAALRNVSFKIRAGERVAIVGESGAGKSTIVYALLRSQDPESGQILVDGHDIRLLDPQHLRHAIGVVEQTVPLFDHSLRYNIEFGLNGRRGEVAQEELEAVAKDASIDRFFGRLEKGFDTMIGERGFKLSGGERQRVGIARALIKTPPILIFDEATSNLDSANEAVIRKSIDRISRGRTTLVIAHRLSTFRTMDRIIVMDRGEVVGDGSHRELMSECERYAELIQHQLHA
jgi:ABC-type multidrug transport system fused ATPase/permease subunit